MRKCPTHNRILRPWESVCPLCDLEVTGHRPAPTDPEDDGLLATAIEDLAVDVPDQADFSVSTPDPSPDFGGFDGGDSGGGGASSDF